MTLKQAIGKLHLWLGLGSGLVGFVVSLTGAIFTFQDEIRDATEPWRLVAAPAAGAPLLPSRLQAAAVAHHAGRFDPRRDEGDARTDVAPPEPARELAHPVPRG